MPLLQIRDMPSNVYETLVRVAQSENRSIAQETVYILRNAINSQNEHIARRKAVFAKLDTVSLTGADSFPAPEDLLREDRDR